MTDVLIPPDIVPQEENIELVDDSTSVFRPSLAPGNTQRAQQAEPRLKVTQTWKSLRLEDKARMMAMLGRLKGRYNSLRALVGYGKRGSFPSTELLTNNTFANGTTGWDAYTAANTDVTVSDRILKATRKIGTSYNYIKRSSATTVSQYAAYSLRAYIFLGRQSNSPTYEIFAGSSLGSGDFCDSIYSSISEGSIISASGVSISTNAFIGFGDNGSVSSGSLSGDSFYISFSSLTQCILVDNRSNLLIRSDEIDNAAWIKARCSVVANTAVAPDGTVTGDGLIEDSTATSTHGITPNINITISSEANSYCYCSILKANTRSWAYINLIEATGSTAATGWFNLSVGVVGSISTGSNWSNVRLAISDIGNGWFACFLIARKTNSATVLSPQVFMTTGDNISTYSGDGSSSIYVWRQGLSQSSTPFNPSQTTSSAVAAVAQTGSSLHVKCGPVSATGSLKTGDLVEINGELKMLTAQLDFDAAGLGYMQFAPALLRSPADNDPVIIGQPLGKFMLSENPKWTNQFGQYADLTLTFEHIYE